MPRTRSTLAPSPAIEVVDPESPYADAPRRATGNLLLGFGDRVIPCAVFAGTEDAGVKRSEYVERDGEFLKVGRASVIKDTGEIVESTDVKRLVESERGLIELTDDEIAQAIGCEGGFAEVEAFLPLSVMTNGQYVVDSLYQLRPAPARQGNRSRRSETTEKAFGLVIKAMRLESVFALVRVALRGKPRYAAFMPDGRLYTLRYQNEVRLPLPLPDTGTLDDNDVMLARMMVVSKTSNVPPVLVDDASALVRAFIEAKAENALPAPAAPRQPDRSYADLIAALRAQVTGLGLNAPAPQVSFGEALDAATVRRGGMPEGTIMREPEMRLLPDGTYEYRITVPGGLDINMTDLTPPSESYGLLLNPAE